MKTFAFLLAVVALSTMAALAEADRDVIYDHITVRKGFTNSGSFSGTTAITKPGVNLIMDNDLGDDIDDVGDLHLAFSLDQIGRANLLAVVCDTPPGTDNRGVAIAQVVGNYFGNTTTLFGNATNAAWHIGVQYFGDLLCTNFATSLRYASNAEPGLVTFRRTLENVIGKTKMIFAGQLDSLKALNLSAADSYSALTGFQLMSNKVSELILVTGSYPSGREFNSYTSIANLGTIIPFLPTNVPVTYFGVTNLGDYVMTFSPPWLSRMDPASPTYMGYTNRAPTGRPAWAQLAIWYAVFGTNFGGKQLFTLIPGTNSWDVTGSNTWHAGPFKDRFASNVVSFATLSNILNSFYVQTPSAVAPFAPQFVAAGTRLSVVSADAAAFTVGSGVTTNLVIDTLHSSMKLGGTNGWNSFNTIPNAVLELVASNASATVDLQPILQGTRPIGPSASWAQSFLFALGRYQSPTSLSPNTQVSLWLLNQSANPLLFDSSTWVSPMNWSGVRTYTGVPLWLPPGSSSTLSLAFSNAPNTGIYGSVNGIGVVSVGTEILRTFTDGLYFPRGMGFRWVPAFGSGYDTLIDSPAVGVVGVSAGNLALAASVAPAPLAGYGKFWPSNYNLYWVTPTKTNLIAVGQ